MITYALLAIIAGGLYFQSIYVGMIGIATVAAGLAFLWKAIPMNRPWAWTWTRRFYTLHLGGAVASSVLLPFRSDEFHREYVDELGWTFGIAMYIIHLAMLCGLLSIVRDALKTPPCARL